MSVQQESKFLYEAGCFIVLKTEQGEVVEHRLRNAPGELAQYREYDYLVLNDQLDQALEGLKGIVDAERSRVRRLKAQS